MEPLDELLADRAEVNAIRLSRPDLRSLTDYELIERARSMQPIIRRLFEHHLTVTAGASIGPGILGAIAEAVGDPSLALSLITGVGDVDSALPSQAMWELSRLDADSDEYRSGFDAFIAEFGSRGPNEWDDFMRSQITRDLRKIYAAIRQKKVVTRVRVAVVERVLEE